VLLADAPAAVKLLRELNGVDREDPWYPLVKCREDNTPLPEPFL
jgi:hypothetical protein